MTRDPVIQQYEFETEGWDRLLEFLKQENVYFKNRLSDIVNSELGDQELDIIEKFQEEFIMQDKIITWLTKELKEQVRLIEKENADSNDDLLTDVVKNQKKLRKDIRKAENMFASVKDNFAQYLADHF